VKDMIHSLIGETLKLIIEKYIPMTWYQKKFTGGMIKE